MAAVMRPKPSEPWSSACLATTGSVTWNSKAKTPASAIMSSGMPSSGVLAT